MPAYIKKANQIHFVIATDMTGRRACYFVQVDPLKEPLFVKAVKGAHINFEQYGTIIASCFGEKPSEAIKTLLKEKYNFDVDA